MTQDNKWCPRCGGALAIEGNEAIGTTVSCPYCGYEPSDE